MARAATSRRGPAQSARTRALPGGSGAADEECPVCLHEFDASALRAKLCAFECGGGLRHAVCRSCDARMWRRHDDRCPICRGPRDLVMSARIHGTRGEGTPVHLQPSQVDAGGEGGGSGPHLIFFPFDHIVDAREILDVASSPRLDRRVGERRSAVFHRLHSNATARVRLRRFARVPRSPLVGDANRDDGVARDDAVDVEDAADDAADDVVDAALDDPQIRAALQGLARPDLVPLGTFLQRVGQSTPRRR